MGRQGSKRTELIPNVLPGGRPAQGEGMGAECAQTGVTSALWHEGEDKKSEPGVNRASGCRDTADKCFRDGGVSLC